MTLFAWEKRFKVLFIFISILILPVVLYVLDAMIGFLGSDMHKNVLTGIQYGFFTLLVFLTIFFWMLFCLMRSYHGFEFDKNKTQLITYYFVFMIILIVDFYYSYTVSSNNEDK